MVVAGFWLVSGMMPAMANSDRFDASLKAALQETMFRFIDNASDDEGGFRYIERQSGVLVTAYPGVIHPKITPVGYDCFLCIDMLAANGTRRLVDFLVGFSFAAKLGQHCASHSSDRVADWRQDRLQSRR